MKIAVLVKQVPGSESSLPINESNDWVDESSITYVMNPPDNFALEEALIIKEKIISAEVVVVSMGPSRVQKVIREGLAKGVDRGIHIQEDEFTCSICFLILKFTQLAKPRAKVCYDCA